MKAMKNMIMSYTITNVQLWHIMIFFYDHCYQLLFLFLYK